MSDDQKPQDEAGPDGVFRGRPHSPDADDAEGHGVRDKGIADAPGPDDADADKPGPNEARRL